MKSDKSNLAPQRPTENECLVTDWTMGCGGEQEADDRQATFAQSLLDSSSLCLLAMTESTRLVLKEISPPPKLYPPFFVRREWTGRRPQLDSDLG